MCVCVCVCVCHTTEARRFRPLRCVLCAAAHIPPPWWAHASPFCPTSVSKKIAKKNIMEPKTKQKPLLPSDRYPPNREEPTTHDAGRSKPVKMSLHAHASAQRCGLAWGRRRLPVERPVRRLGPPLACRERVVEANSRLPPVQSTVSMRQVSKKGCCGRARGRGRRRTHG